MDFSFNNSVAMVYDFLRIILEKYNNLDSSSLLDESGIERDTSISHAKQKIGDNKFKSTPGLSLFFQKEKGHNSFIAHIYDIRLPEFSSISAMIADFMVIADDNLLLKLLQFYGASKNDNSFYHTLLADEITFYEYLLSMEQLSDKQRLEFMALYSNPSTIMTPLYQLLKWTEKEVLKIYADNNDQIRTFERLMKSKIKNNPDELVSILSHLSNASIPNDKTKNITLSYSFLNEILIYAIGKTNPTVLLGIHYEKYLKVIEHDDFSITNENFLKAFSDAKRLEIIRMLNGKEMFVGEITKNCKLSFSTTSYHIDILLNAGILHRRISNRRVYYKLNVDYLPRKLDQIKRSILSNTF